MFSRAFVLGVSLAAYFSPLTARSQAPTSSSTATLQVNTQLVILDTVVTDNHGELVKGLKRDDFKVYQDGVEQRVRDFDVHSSEADTPLTPKKDRNGRDDWGEVAKTILVLDELNTPFDEMAYSREEVNRYLKAQPAHLPGPTMIMFVNDLGFHPLGSYTRDSQTLRDEVAAHKPRLPDKLARGATGEMLQQSFSLLQQIAISTRGEKGRKVVLWIGKGFPAVNVKALFEEDQQRFESAIRYTSNLLLDARVTVYKIEPTSGQPPPDNLSDEGDETSAETIQDPSLENFNFNSFVVQTGGRYVYGQNDLDDHIAASVVQGSNYYTLTYSPPAQMKQDDYNKVRIVMRNPAFHASTKQGFYPPSQIDPHPKRKQLGFELYEAAISGMTYSGLGVRVDQCVAGSTATEISCRVSVDTNRVALEDAGEDGRKATIVVVLAGLDGKGSIVSATEKEFTSVIPAGDPRSLEAGHLAISFHGPLALNSRTARMVVRDTSGKIGTFNLPLDPVTHRPI